MFPQVVRSFARVSGTPVANFTKISYTLPNLNDVAEQLIKSGSFNETELNNSIERAEAVIAQHDAKTVADIIKLRETNEVFKIALQGIEKQKAAYLKKNLLLHYVHEQHTTEPVKVTVTGASGAIGYALLFRIASGAMLGKNQRVHLNLLELPGAMKALEGVVMELKDCAFPLLSGITATSDPNEAFADSSYALLVGAQPRTKGMERGDLLSANGKIFIGQGKAINDNARKDIKVLVVGNPANTNAYIAANSAPKIDPANFTAMTRLDHNRGLAQIAEKTGSTVDSIKRFCIWGNHSSTQYPDVSNTQIEGKWAKDILKQDWLEKTFIPTVQQRGAAIIAARGASSAASAASSAIDHMHDWVLGTNGEWTSMAVLSDGSYGITKGLYSSFPVTCQDGNYSIVQNVPLDKFSAARIEASHKELLEERNAVSSLLKH